MSTLRELLQDKAGRLYKEFEGLIPRCENHLEFTTPREFTMHGAPHCVRVERNLDDLIPDRLKKAMSGTEIYILLCGAWFHDFGMVKPSDRSVHNVQSARLIEEKWGEHIGWPYAHVVKRLCYAHRDHEVNGEKINTLSLIFNHNSLVGGYLPRNAAILGGNAPCSATY
jgi:HD superfamily phosphodiesterase